MHVHCLWIKVCGPLQIWYLHKIVDGKQKMAALWGKPGPVLALHQVRNIHHQTPPGAREARDVAPEKEKKKGPLLISASIVPCAICLSCNSSIRRSGPFAAECPIVPTSCAMPFRSFSNQIRKHQSNPTPKCLYHNTASALNCAFHAISDETTMPHHYVTGRALLTVPWSSDVRYQRYDI